MIKMLGRQDLLQLEGHPSHAQRCAPDTLHSHGGCSHHGDHVFVFGFGKSLGSKKIGLWVELTSVLGRGNRCFHEASWPCPARGCLLMHSRGFCACRPSWPSSGGSCWSHQPAAVGAVGVDGAKVTPCSPRICCYMSHQAWHETLQSQVLHGHVVLQNMPHMSQSLLEFRVVAVLPQYNSSTSSWGIYSMFCDTDARIDQMVAARPEKGLISQRFIINVNW